jgi:hypothetical protein
VKSTAVAVWNLRTISAFAAYLLSRRGADLGRKHRNIGSSSKADILHCCFSVTARFERHLHKVFYSKGGGKDMDMEVFIKEKKGPS